MIGLNKLAKNQAGAISRRMLVLVSVSLLLLIVIGASLFTGGGITGKTPIGLSEEFISYINTGKYDQAFAMSQNNYIEEQYFEDYFKSISENVDLENCDYRVPSTQEDYTVQVLCPYEGNDNTFVIKFVIDVDADKQIQSYVTEFL